MTSRPSPMISVESVLQVDPSMDGAGPGPGLARQQHRIAEGTTIRQMLQQAGLNFAIVDIEAARLGLSCHGRRAWLDQLLADADRVEIVAPIRADAKAARTRRVAADRARRKLRFGSRG
ncbi:MAG: RnfH family protein [Lautropia sp.]